MPLVLGGVAIVMLAMGWNLERISLGSLIIALGLLVDDAIIAVEMMVVKMEAGWDRVKAAAFSYSSTAVPRLTGALITVAAFMPIGFSKSTTGEYAGGIFWIVGAAVLFSWLVSGLFTPYLAVKMLPKDLGKHHAGGDPYDTPFYRKLRGWIDLAIRTPLVGHRRHRCSSGARGRRFEARAAAVLPEQHAARADRRAAREGRRLLCRDDRTGEANGEGPVEGRGCPLLHRVYRRRRTALLSLAQPRVAEPGLCPVHRDDP